MLPISQKQMSYSVHITMLLHIYTVGLQVTSAAWLLTFLWLYHIMYWLQNRMNDIHTGTMSLIQRVLEEREKVSSVNTATIRNIRWHSVGGRNGDLAVAL